MFRFFMLIQLGLMLVGSVWMELAGYAAVKSPDPLRDSLVFLLLFWGLMGLERVFSLLFPRSFQAAEALHGQLGTLMRTQGISHHQALLLALASGVGEELFFRGALQNALWGGWLGVFLQAVVFTALHPVPDRKAWSYPLFVFLGGLGFGAAYLLTGSLIPGMLAHYLHNARGFYQLLDQPKAGGQI
ncbi:CPBP family intramembrane glutamic endopeptidase [Meiothermus ruber]|jgi:membrane protease YdiL (CAAX protease family)|uniref:Abortive infection protein n=1 Tax=Meiothermus ruber (strain ATCC 35948 / DSM 1279 / VKM B-1258 / 21) TaxID=504728 RepID=D3PS35_MEIRD|nr:CPBP family intramembrane glutamic endopeptidase [Meiothermus ruber]ADD28268.1 Abortive infection protein [Meiothermus ruber DSM 1279]AGK06292.1 abortive infection protein [Meiothermus ruber DSM 1279]MCL6529650.1 CPBP family intramembrane metalloprotease [Meiothermus ruber]MCX7802256.1 CPBP family intramembrane metalloprotease [Meiothermus ruber]